MKEDTLSYIRNNKEITFEQKIRLVIMLSLPTILAQVSSIIMQYIDASMVGRLGAGCSASIGLVSTTTWLLGSLASAPSLGFSIQVAQLVGAKKFNRARRVFLQSFGIVLLISIIIGAAGAMISWGLPAWLGGEESIRKDATMYFLITSLSMPALGFNRLGTRMLQSCGNTKTPGILNSMNCLLDVIFNFIFIFKWHGFGFGLGVMGAALGTTAAEIVTTIIMFIVLMFRTPMLSKGYGTDPDEKAGLATIKKSFVLSLPVTFENVVMFGAMITITRIVAPLGVVAVAANSFAITAESLCYMPAYGIEEAATALVGQSIGAGRGKLALSFGRISVAFGMGIMAFTGLLMFIFAPFMIGILTPDPAVRELGVRILRIEAFAEPLYGASIVVTGVLRGAGDTLVSSLMNFFSLWAVRVVLSFLLVGSYGLVGVWIAMAAELCFRGVIFLVRMERKKWLKKV